MSDPSIVDVLTLPGYRRGPSGLGLFIIGVVFLVPGVIAPLGVLQVIGVLWVVAALVTAIRDVAHVRSTR